MIFLSGQLDLDGGIYYSQGLDEYFAYPEYNCGYSKVVLMARKNDSSIRSYDLSSFSGKTIGVFDRATENIRRLQEYLHIHGITCSIRYYTYEEMMPGRRQSLSLSGKRRCGPLARQQRRYGSGFLHCGRV